MTVSEREKNLVKFDIFFGMVYEVRVMNRFDVIADTDMPGDSFLQVPLKVENGLFYLNGFGGTGDPSHIKTVVGRILDAEVIEAYFQGIRRQGRKIPDDLRRMIEEARTKRPKPIFLRPDQLGDQNRLLSPGDLQELYQRLKT